MKGTIKHGHTTWKGPRTKVYKAWCHIKSRCYNPSVEHYDRYGGRGIIVCDAWKDDFISFFNYIGHPPTESHSIDRFPNRDGNYEPGNVRWATKSEQAINRNVKGAVLCFGKKTSSSEASRITGVSIYTIQSWSVFYEADVADIAAYVAEWRRNSDKRPNIAARFAKKSGGRKHGQRNLRVKEARNA